MTLITHLSQVMKIVAEMLKRLLLLFLLQFYANDESDPDLPSVNYRLPANWEPNIKSMNFLKIASDSEWKKEERLIMWSISILRMNMKVIFLHAKCPQSYIRH